MDRNAALELIKLNVKNENLIKHMLAVEAIMCELAKFLSENEETWSLTGLLHDIDFEKTFNNPNEHGFEAEKILKGKVNEEILRAIKAHNYEYTNVKPESKMEKALIAADAISGLIIACALVMPSKKLKDVKIETLKKKFKDKDFARGSSRERILICEEIGVTKEKFFEIALKALQEISLMLGL
ncbi:MAG: HDIG domain-containing protein [Candidatus Bathyarchaeia archaeon]